MTKKCNGKCQQEKDVSEFSKDKFSKDGYLYQCKECNKKYFRKYYQNNKQNYKGYEQKQIRPKKERLKEFLSHYKCADCGNKDVNILEFDHIYGKDNEIMDLAYTKWEDFLEEFKKCEVRCRNHHRRRHMVELNSYKWKWLNGELKPLEIIIYKEGIKICTKCKLPKSYSEFGISKWEKDGHNNYCKECDYIEQRKYYLKYRDKEVKNIDVPIRNWRKVGKLLDIQIYICEYLSTHPCVDCGEKDILMLEFDHIRGEKYLDISSMVGNNYNLEEIKEEIEKCDVRCCNCHKVKTFYSLGH